jgi:hypothetical protein
MSFGGLIRTERNQALFYSLLVGTAVFIYVTGGAIINPTNRDWLMFGDAAQHYLGWEFFRHTPLLQWPIGANYPLGMELSSSIVFTDSIPIAAYIAKLFNPILPATFQYLGIWIWLCFVLQAFFAQRFLWFFLSNKAHVYLGACFVVLSPPLIYRLVHAGYGHIALASHWLILASFCLYLRPGRNDLRWSLLIALCWLIQAYFAPMVAAIWIASLVKRLFIDGERLSLLKSTGVVALTSLIVMWASGYFMIGSNFNPEGWNYVFRWQPLSLVDSGADGSTGWSHLLGDRAQLDGETEAFSFLGTGVIVLMAISLARAALQNRMTKVLVAIGTLGSLSLLFVSITRSLPLSRVLSMCALLVVFAFFCATLLNLSRLSNSWRTYVPLIIAVCMLAVYSMTNRVGFAQQTLFEYPLFSPLRQFTETFRTHGRSIWPLYYLAIFAAVVVFAKTSSKKYTGLLLLALFCFQVIDSSSAISLARHRFDSPQWVSPMKDPRWEMFAKNYKHVVVVPPLNDDQEERWIVIDDFANRYRLGTNSGSFSRFDQNVYTKSYQDRAAELISGKPNKDTLYIVDDLSVWETISRGALVESSLIIDNFRVVAP